MTGASENVEREAILQAEKVARSVGRARPLRLQLNRTTTQSRKYKIERRSRRAPVSAVVRSRSSRQRQDRSRMWQGFLSVLSCSKGGQLDSSVHVLSAGTDLMIRVTTTEELSHTVVVIEGQLLRDSTEVVETSCAEAEAHGKPVHLLLRDVSAVDRDGQMALRRLAAKGVHIEAKGIYTSYLVEALTAGDREQNGSLTKRRAMSDTPAQRRS